MKLYFSEFKSDYDKYLFPYQVWLCKEERDSVEKIYENGLLPIRSIPSVYFLSRSVRVDLSKFDLSSENRRILKKTKNFSSKVISLSDFNYSSMVQKMCSSYADEKLGKDVLPTSTIRAIFKNGVYNNIIVFTDNSSGREVGYAVCYINKNLIQYAFSFYELKYLKDNLGARMMLEAVLWSKTNDKSYIYLGSCYSRESLYKTEYKGVEFFNGFTWSTNLEELKYLLERNSGDYLLKDKDYLDTFYEGRRINLLSNKGIRVNF